MTDEQSFVTEWQDLVGITPQPVRDTVAAVVTAQSAELAEMFYQTMTADDDAGKFLDSQLVSERLLVSMQGWLRELFAGSPVVEELYRRQYHIGSVHARIQIPVKLVARGARLLRRKIGVALTHSDLERTELVSAIQYVEELIDLALGAMTASYVTDNERLARTDEAYKLFAFGQNMVAERERQRAALHEWAHQLLTRHIHGVQEDGRYSLGRSEFGIWLEHKASVIFDESPEVARIRRCIEDIDGLFVGFVNGGVDPSRSRETLKEIDSKIGLIKFLMGEMFEHYIQLEAGRDALTQLLNRRYLPSVLSREMQIARQNKLPFALLLLDIDHFKKINDAWGHSGGDMVLQQAAELISGSVRAGDFVFRYGGEEMLIVLVEATADKAMLVAETIRQKFEQAQLRVGTTETSNVTVSVGVSYYDGHPDYERLIKAADGALYEAKESGRNRCVMAQ